jgi:hypothetical protein
VTISEPAARRTVVREADAEAGRQLNTLAGWRRFIDGPPAPGPVVPERSAADVGVRAGPLRRRPP